MEPQRRKLWRGVALRGSWLWGSQIQVTSEGGTIGINILAYSPPFNQSPAWTVSRKTVSLFPWSSGIWDPHLFLWHHFPWRLLSVIYLASLIIIYIWATVSFHSGSSSYPTWVSWRSFLRGWVPPEALICSYHNYCLTSDWSKKDVIFLLLFCLGFHWHL